MHIIQNNPYRTIGLLVGATATEQRRQTTRLQRFLEAELEPEEDFSFPVMGKLQRTAESVNKAASKLDLNSDKMNFALFWFYKGNSISDEPAFDAMKLGNTDEVLNIWTNLVSNGEVSERNASAYNNLATLYLSGVLNDRNTKKEQIAQGVHLKLRFLGSEFVKHLKSIATDETFKTSKRELQLQFLNQIQAEIKKTNAITLYEFLDILSKQDFIAKDDFLKNIAQQPIEDIEKNIEESKAKRKHNKDGAIEIGKALLRKTSAKLKLVKTILDPSNLSYSSIADKVANEVLQCSVEYFNYHQKLQSDFDYFKPALELARSTELIAVGKLTKDRIKDNLSTLENMKYQEINEAIAFLKSVKEVYEKNKRDINEHINDLIATDLDIIMGRKTINFSIVEENIKNSLNWNKVVELVREIIPIKNVDKIKRGNNSILLNEYKSLVRYLLDKLNYSQQRELNYLSFWESSPAIKATVKQKYKKGKETSDGTNTENILLLIGIVIWIIVIATDWGDDLEGSPLFLIVVAWLFFFSWKTPYIIIKKTINVLK